MKNCLVTKFNSVVENDNLPRLGTLSFQIKNAPSGWISIFSVNSGNGEISYSEGGYVTTGSGSDTKRADTANVGTSQSNIYSCSGNYTLFFEDNYDAKNVDMSSLYTLDAIACDISQFKYRKEAQFIRIVGLLNEVNQGNLIGDIDDFSELTGLTTLVISGSHNVIGDISVLKDLTACEALEFGYTKVGGSYESLLSGMCTNRTSGEILIDCRGSDVTLHNASVGSVRHKIVFSATGCEVQPYGGGTAIATYTKANDTWTYA